MTWRLSRSGLLNNRQSCGTAPVSAIEYQKVKVSNTATTVGGKSVPSSSFRRFSLATMCVAARKQNGSCISVMFQFIPQYRPNDLS